MDQLNLPNFKIEPTILDQNFLNAIQNHHQIDIRTHKTIPKTKNQDPGQDQSLQTVYSFNLNGNQFYRGCTTNKRALNPSFKPVRDIFLRTGMSNTFKLPVNQAFGLNCLEKVVVNAYDRKITRFKRVRLWKHVNIEHINLYTGETIFKKPFFSRTIQNAIYNGVPYTFNIVTPMTGLVGDLLADRENPFYLAVLTNFKVTDRSLLPLLPIHGINFLPEYGAVDEKSGQPVLDKSIVLGNYSGVADENLLRINDTCTVPGLNGLSVDQQIAGARARPLMSNPSSIVFQNIVPPVEGQNISPKNRGKLSNKDSHMKTDTTTSASLLCMIQQMNAPTSNANNTDPNSSPSNEVDSSLSLSPKPAMAIINHLQIDDLSDNMNSPANFINSDVEETKDNREDNPDDLSLANCLSKVFKRQEDRRSSTDNLTNLPTSHSCSRSVSETETNELHAINFMGNQSRKRKASDSSPPSGTRSGDLTPNKAIADCIASVFKSRSGNVTPNNQNDIQCIVPLAAKKIKSEDATENETHNQILDDEKTLMIRQLRLKLEDSQKLLRLTEKDLLQERLENKRLKSEIIELRK